MNILKANIPTPQSKLGQFVLSGVLTLLVIYGIALVSAFQSHSNNCTDLFGVNSYECSVIRQANTGILLWLGFSSYFALLPFIVPVSIVWKIFHGFLRPRENVKSVPPNPKILV